MPDVDHIIRQLKSVLEMLEYLHPAQDAKECERTIRGVIGQLKESPQAAPAKPTPRTTIKPCWAAANRVYEWGIKRLPPSRHNYRDILQAAGTRADAPAVRLPKDSATFAKYVCLFRKARGLPNHRQMRRFSIA